MKHCLLGAIWGDICGVPYEFNSERNAERIDLRHPKRAISDDTVLTLAVAKAILEPLVGALPVIGSNSIVSGPITVTV